MSQTMNSFTHLHIHITIIDELFADILFLNYIFRKIYHFEVYVYVSLQWSVELESFKYPTS